MAASPHPVWRTARRKFELGPRPLVMGILNVTPDSFHDGGQHATPEAALAQAERLIAEGADLLDIGGESTRPGAAPVSAGEELRRVLPVVEALRERHPDVALSVDTAKAEVAAATLEAGAEIINDVSAGEWDRQLWAEVAINHAGYILTHCQGTPATMQENPAYGDVVTEVTDYLAARLDEAEAAGIDRFRILLDPGIGFGKTFEHNLALLGNLERLGAAGRPLALGVSHKSFLRRLLGEAPEATLLGSLVTQTLCYTKGVRLWRVHDVAPAVQAAKLIEAVAAAPLAP
ncbi:MAG: dihydropteroate synthase [Verrucomicrobiota bacterium]